MATNRVFLLDEPFEPWSLLASTEQQLIASGELPTTAMGACGVFVGRMRDFNEGDEISEMLLSHYPGMTERELVRISDEIITEHQLLSARIWHRVGRISPGESIVLVVTWASHRAPALAACHALVEALKARAPFWKKETTANGERWVASNTPN